MNVPQLAGALIAVFTPLLVVLILSRTAAGARRVARTGQLAGATLVGALLVAVLMLTGAVSGSLAGAISLGLFVLLSVVGWPAMGRIESAALQAMAEQRPPRRVASLQPRTADDIAPRALRWTSLAILAIAAPFFVWRIAAPPASTKLGMPILFAAVAVVFYALYEAWIRGEGQGVLHLESGESEEAARHDRRRRVFRLYGIQLALVSVFLMLSLVLLSIDWTTRGGEIVHAIAVVVGGVTGVVGCAFAISSGITPTAVRRSARDGEARQA